MILLNSVISSLGLYAYSLDVTNFQERSDVILAVLFGVVGLRSTVDENLPKLEYSTLCVYILNSSYYMLMIGKHDPIPCPSPCPCPSPSPYPISDATPNPNPDTNHEPGS